MPFESELVEIEKSAKAHLEAMFGHCQDCREKLMLISVVRGLKKELDIDES